MSSQTTRTIEPIPERARTTDASQLSTRHAHNQVMVFPLVRRAMRANLPKSPNRSRSPQLNCGILTGMESGSRLVQTASEGCYEASRAAALSGVPISTVYYWARTGIVVPSVSPVREKLWSYADLMALRVVSWLRHPKESDDAPLPASPMPQVRRALAEVERRGLQLWEPDAVTQSPLLVDRRGRVHLRAGGQITDLRGQLVLGEDLLDLLAPFAVAGGNGPDLIAPRERLRIVPARVAGEPHVAGSRLTTLTLAALASRGMSHQDIAGMYEIDVEAVDEAVDLERQLNTASVAA